MKEQIEQHVRANSARFVDLLKQACAIPSVSTEGQGFKEMATWLESKLQGLGAEVTRLSVDGSPDALLGVIKGKSERALLIYDHYDVQPVDPIDLWVSPPFEPTERDGRVFARGVADNKGDLIARLCAIETYHELYGQLPFTTKFFVEGEEESGSANFEKICHTYREELKADDCVWEGGWFDHDGIPMLYFGCKGLLYVELRVKRLSGDQHSSIAVYAPSAAWDLLRAIASIKDEEGRITIEGFYDGITEPSPREHELIEALPFNEAAQKQNLGIDGFVGGLTGAALKHDLLYQPTANIAGFHTGYGVPGASKTVLPAEAMAKLDFRLVPDQDAQDVANKLRAHLSKHGFDHITVDVLSGENPSKSPLDSKLAIAAESTARDWFPQGISIYPFMWATGPMYPIATGLGIPISSPAGVGRPDSNVHAPNENARIEDYLEVIGYTVAYLHRYGQV